MKRFKEQMQIAPQSFDMGTEGAYRALSSIGDRLSSFEDKMIQKRVQKAKLRGVEEARGAELQKVGGVTQRPEEREVGFFGKHQDQAYNATIMDSYVASVDTDMMDSINAIYADNQDNVIGLNEGLAGFWAGFSKSIDPAIVGEASISFQSKSSQVRRSATINSKNKHTNIAVSELKSSASKYAREASTSNYNGESLESAESLMKFDASIESLKKANPENKAVYDELKRDAHKDVASQKFKRDIDAEFDKDPESASEKIRELDKKVPKGWEPNEWNSFLRSEEVDVNRRKRQIKVEEKKTELTNAQITTNIIASEGTQKDKYWEIKSKGFKPSVEKTALKSLEMAYIPTKTNEITYTDMSYVVGTLGKALKGESFEKYLDRVQKSRNVVTDKFNKGELSYQKYLELTDDIDKKATPLLSIATEDLKDEGVWGNLFETDWENSEAIDLFNVYTAGNMAQTAQMFGRYNSMTRSLQKSGIADEEGKINPMLKNLPELEKLVDILKINDPDSNAARKEIARQVEVIETEKRKEMAGDIVNRALATPEQVGFKVGEIRDIPNKGKFKYVGNGQWQKQ